MGIFENDMPFKGGFSLNGVSLVRLRKHFYVLILFLRKECDGMAYQRELKMYQMLEHQSVDFRY